jgi:hypothetical protein
VEGAAKKNRLKVTLGYNLARNGSVSAVRVEKSSGNQQFDDSAIQAVGCESISKATKIISHRRSAHGSGIRLPPPSYWTKVQYTGL